LPGARGILVIEPRGDLDDGVGLRRDLAGQRVGDLRRELPRGRAAVPGGDGPGQRVRDCTPPLRTVGQAAGLDRLE